MAKAIPTPHYTTFFCACKMLRIFLIGLAKRQLPRTLGEINIEIIIYVIDNILNNIYNKNN